MAIQKKELISKLDTSSDRTAEKVIARLVKVGAPVVPQLIQAASDLSRPRLRKWSLQALGAIGDVSAAPILIQALRDPRMTVKLHAIRGLARMGHKPGATSIRRLLADPSGGIRVNAIDALICLNAKAAASSIMTALGDEQWIFRGDSYCLRLSLSDLKTTASPS